MTRWLYRLRLLILFAVIWRMTVQEGGSAPPVVLPPVAHAPGSPAPVAHAPGSPAPVAHAPGSPGCPPMNVIVEVSRDLASAAAEKTKVSPEIVDEVINGAKVDGTGT